MVEVRVFATFREGRDKVSFIDESEYPDVLSVVNYLKIEREEVAIMLINGFHQKLQSPLKDGDVLSIFPAVGGG